MHFSKIVLNAAAVILTATASSAATFQYSYVFGDGTEVSGTFEGTQNGQYVENVSNITLFLDGVQESGPFFDSSFNGSAWGGDAVVSFDGDLNNFFFADSDYGNGDLNWSAGFFYVNEQGAFQAFARADGAALGHSDEPAVDFRWSLTAVSSNAVPDGGATIAFLGTGIAGLALLRRKL